jgi:hypothetical protein
LLHFANGTIGQANFELLRHAGACSGRRRLALAPTGVCERSEAIQC